MYLIEIDKETGLIKEDPLLDGWFAIPSFRAIASQENGLEKLTVIALFTDYLSPIRFYGVEDRYKKAMDIVFQKRDLVFWAKEETQKAVEDYKTLQYSHDLEEGKMYKQEKIKALQKVQSGEDANGDPLSENDKQTLFRRIKELNTNIDDFEKRNETKDLFSESPVRNNYKLSRLEQKLLNKKSFYYGRDNLNHPGQQ